MRWLWLSVGALLFAGCAPMRTDDLSDRCGRQYNACMNTCERASGILGKEVAVAGCVNDCNHQARTCDGQLY